MGKAGTRLGRYEIVEEIGAGGMGEVYRARDTLLGREVAVKVLPAEMARDGTARQRFEREATLLASLSHPNVLAIHDFGEADGILYAVMELLAGETLRERLTSGRLEPGAALALALDIARGMAAAHARGIVHRDLKPENVFLPTGMPLKILDFGLARAPDPVLHSQLETGPVGLRTGPGTVMGTVGYMSPEQLLGDATDLRTDVFAFGVVFFEMLAGTRPFAGQTRAEITSAILRGDARPLPAFPGSPRFDAVVRVCLDRRPEARYQTSTALVTALEALQPAAPGSSAAAPILQAREAANSIAVLPFADMSADRSLDYLCEGIAEEILMALTKVSGLRVVARSSAFRFRGSGEDARAVGTALGVETLLEGSVRAAGGRLRVTAQLVETENGYQLWSERFDRQADDVFALQDEIAGAVAATLRVRLRGASGISAVPAPPRDPEAYTQYLHARHHWNRRTEADLHRSLEYLGRALELDGDYVQAHAGMGEAYVTLGIYGALPPHQAMTKARDAATRALAIGPAVPAALATLGCVAALYDWSWSEAERFFQRALALPGSVAARPWYALNYLVPLGRFEEAEAELRRALEVDPLSLPITAGLGITMYYARRHDDALAALSSSLDLDRAFAISRQFRGLVLSELGRHDEAQAETDAAARAAGDSAETLAAAGYVAGRAGDSARARRLLLELETRARERYVSPGLMAQILAGMDRGDAALDALEEAAGLRSADLAWLGARPIFDRLRDHPRLAALERRILPSKVAG